MSHPTTYAVDFDGTLCENAYPEIGAPNLPLIDNTEELKRAYGTNPRKIGADYYIDDKAMLPDLFVP